MRKRKLFCLDAPLGLGQPRKGVENAPQHLHKYGLTSRLASVFQVEHEELRFDEPRGVHNSEAHYLASGQACSVIFEKVRNAAEHGRVCLTLGGDHSIAFATLPALESCYEDLRVVWFDAHGDANTPETSPSGNLHGMPLAAALGQVSKGSLPGFEWLQNFVKPENVALVGVRALDEEERRNLERLGIQIYSAADVAKLGMLTVIRDIESRLKTNEHPVHLSFDIDGVDPRCVPSTGTPEPDGVSLEDALMLVNAMYETDNLVGMDFVELNPHIEPAASRQSILASIDIIVTALCGRVSLKKQGVA